MSVKCPGCGKIFDSNPPKFCDDCGTAISPSTQTAQPVNPTGPQQIKQNTQNPQPSAQSHQLPPQMLQNSTPNPQMGQPQGAYVPPNSPYGGQPQAQYSPPPYNRYQPMPQNLNTAPLSVGGFMITQLVLMIPIVGFIMAIVWAVGGQNTNVNRTNFCRSYFIWLAIGLIVGILGGIILGAVIAPLIAELISDMTGAYGSSYYYW